jgi:tellurite methyltransferase
MEAKEKWDNKYQDIISSKEEREPNERLLKVTPHIKGESAIDIACGLGGNSFFLAESGFNVTALDISDVAINFVSEQAEIRGLEIRAYAADMSKGTDFPFPAESYDLAVITYYLDRSIFPQVKEMVKSKGYFFMETFFKTSVPGKKTVSEKFKLESNELLREFIDWTILFFEECEYERRQTILCKKK